MLTIFGPRDQGRPLCDGVTRRNFLQVGGMGAVGLTLPQLLRCEARAGIRNSHKSVILIYLVGGPPHQDMFDLKPDAPTEIAGPHRPISTNVPGIEISEHLPKLAQCADKFAILRGVSHTLAAHRLGSEYVNTGNRPLASLEYPGFGPVVAKESERDNPIDLPPLEETAEEWDP